MVYNLIPLFSIDLTKVEIDKTKKAYDKKRKVPVKSGFDKAKDNNV